MGLDMYLFRCKTPKIKPSAFLSRSERQKLENERVCFFPADEAPVKCKSFMDNCVEVTSVIPVYDFMLIANRICEECGLEYDPEMEDHIYVSSVCSTGSTLVYRPSPDTSHSIELSVDDIERMTINKKEKEYAIILEEVAYQRKGLNDRGWELMACDNCDYTDDYDAVKAMVDEGDLSDDFINNWEDGDTVFHPWW